MSNELVSDAEIERLFAEVTWETGEIPPLNAAQLAYAIRVVRKALFRERTIEPRSA